MGDACSWKRLLNYNSQSSVWHFMWLSHSPGPFPSVSQSFLLTASVALRLVEILEKRKATGCCWRAGSSLTEMKAGMEGEEGGHGTGQRGRRKDRLPPSRSEVEQPHSLCALSAPSHVRLGAAEVLSGQGRKPCSLVSLEVPPQDGLPAMPHCLVTQRGPDPSPDPLTQVRLPHVTGSGSLRPVTPR